MKRLAKNILGRFGYELRRKRPRHYSRTVVSLQPDGKAAGNVLLAYILTPFLDAEEIHSNRHTHYWESWRIAHTFLENGYAVDVIDYRFGDMKPEKAYDIFVSARTNLERISRQLNTDCLKIAHLDTAHWIVNNQASLTRCLNLYKRRGILSGSIRLVEPNRAIEHADAGTVLGNRFTMDSYRFAGKPIYPIPISTCKTYPWNDAKDFDAVKRSFIWLGSEGFVHKGLDLVLEAFSQLPDHHLYVCGPIDEDRDFSAAFHQELHETPNIHTLGWVDVGGAEFSELMQKCVGIVYPSCAEGGGGCVVNCMHGGLIPIVTEQASVDVADFGIVLPDDTVASIVDAVSGISGTPAGRLREMALNAWRYAREHHTRDHFAGVYEKFVGEILQQGLRN